MSETPDDLALKRALDALPRSIDPPEDLWPAVRGRLAPRRPQSGWRTARIAAGLVVIAAGAALLANRSAAGGRWQVAPLAGTRFEPREFAAGQALSTGAASRMLLEVGTIGHVELDTGTSVRLVEARATHHRLALSRGTIHARISAPPRLFVVETPAGTAWDLGCAYTLTVDSAGNSVMEVTHGWVAFEYGERESLVPAGFSVVSRRDGRGVGTPVAVRASEALRRAVAALDSGDASALERVLAEARREDAITVWHLLSRTEGAGREAVFTRLETLVPPPRGVTRANALELDRVALRLWWQELPGSLELVPRWTRTIWTMWLRLFG